MAKIKPAAGSGLTTQENCLIHCNWLFNCWQYFPVLASFKFHSKESCLIVGIYIYWIHLRDQENNIFSLAYNI